MATKLPIQSAQVVVPCADLAATLEFLTARLGFRIDLVVPADAPATVVVSGHGVSLRLEAGAAGAAPALRLACDPATLPPDTPRELIAPGGMRVVLADALAPIELPAGTREFVLTRMGGAGAWGVGRAGMQYRDLIPGRLGGRFIASHIRIPDGGTVPDYVHYHRVRFQMIYCRAGWVRVVYEDQGPPFVMHAGDCVLQPPQIRHRVLEASAGLEVIEIGSPAVHETWADHALSLPTDGLRPGRDFGGQRFVRHVAASARWAPWRAGGFEARDTGIAAATGGLAGARVARARIAATATVVQAGELLFWFVLAGGCRIDGEQVGAHDLVAGDCCVLPPDSPVTLAAGAGLELLEVALPA